MAQRRRRCRSLWLSCRRPVRNSAAEHAAEKPCFLKGTGFRVCVRTQNQPYFRNGPVSGGLVLICGLFWSSHARFAVFFGPRTPRRRWGTRPIPLHRMPMGGTAGPSATLRMTALCASYTLGRMSATARRVPGGRQINHRILIKEARWRKCEAARNARLHWMVFRTRQMMQSETMPEN